MGLARVPPTALSMLKHSLLFLALVAFAFAAATAGEIDNTGIKAGGNSLIDSLLNEDVTLNQDDFQFAEIEEDIETQNSTTLSDEEWAYVQLLHARRTAGFTCANGAPAGTTPLTLDCQLQSWAKQNVPLTQASFRRAHRARAHRASIFFTHGRGSACPALQLELQTTRMCGYLARARFNSFAVVYSGGRWTVLLSRSRASSDTSCFPTAWVPPLPCACPSRVTCPRPSGAPLR